MSLNLYVHPGSYSCWCTEVLLQELGAKYTVHEINLHSGAQYSPEFLALSERGNVPVLKVEEVTLVGAPRIREYLGTTEPYSMRDIFKGKSEAYLDKLDSVPVGHMTYGLAFHLELSKVLRYPYSNGDYPEMAREYVLNRGGRLQEAALNSPDPAVTQSLLEYGEEHQKNISRYVNYDEYKSVLRSVSAVLDFFEAELGKPDASFWLGGHTFGSADILLGLLLHRIWQIGLESEMFSDGVRPHLTVYYDRIKKRPSFCRVTRWSEETREIILKTTEDKFVENAKVGVGMMLLMGGLYVGKKIFAKK